MFLGKWKTGLQEDKETVVLGDINIDWFTCFQSDPPPNSQAYRLRPLVMQLVMKILTQGVCQLVNSVTRSWPGHPDSCLDLIFTNRPEKMSPVEVHIASSSDHRYVQVTRHTKTIQTQPRFITKRCYKKL